MKNGLAKGVCLNVNIPKLHIDEIKGIKACRQASGTWNEELDERKDPYGRKYYWLTGNFENFEPTSTDTDAWALDNGFVSIVPSQFDLTAHESIIRLSKLDGKI